MNLPYFWSRLSFPAKAAYLCSSKQARDYSHACTILASLPRRRRTKAHQPTLQTSAKKLWYQD